MAPDNPQNSQASLLEADRDRISKSRYGGLGGAGYISHENASQAGAFLASPGEVAVVNASDGGWSDLEIAVAWDNVVVQREKGLLRRFIKKNILHKGVDLDLGCLYKLKNASRGSLQAFGDVHGALKEEPYIALSSDERTGDREGPDETLLINGAHWADIEKLLIYVYIYDGAKNWATVHPQVQVRVPGEPPMVVTLNASKKGLPVCAVAGLENIRGGIKMTSYLEYFPGHEEMDRAFGYGIPWESGSKDH